MREIRAPGRCDGEERIGFFGSFVGGGEGRRFGVSMVNRERMLWGVWVVRSRGSTGAEGGQFGLNGNEEVLEEWRDLSEMRLVRVSRLSELDS